MTARAHRIAKQVLLAVSAENLVDAVDKLLAVVTPGELADRLAAKDRQPRIKIRAEHQPTVAASRAAGLHDRIEARFRKNSHRSRPYITIGRPAPLETSWNVMNNIVMAWNPLTPTEKYVIEDKGTERPFTG